MTLAEVRDLLKAEVLWAEDLLLQVDGAAAADLMSDVLGLGRPGLLLLTALASRHAIRTAEIADIGAVVFVRGKRPLDEVVEAAREAGIPVMVTPLEMLEAAGLLYAALPRTAPSRPPQDHVRR
jgi:predicted transcriptional regulator